MKQIFTGRWVYGFGRVAAMATKEKNKSKEVKQRERILVFWEKYGLAATKEKIGNENHQIIR